MRGLQQSTHGIPNQGKAEQYGSADPGTGSASAPSATKKITRAMELMAASRVVKAQQAVRESTPYARALTTAVSAVATTPTGSPADLGRT